METTQTASKVGGSDSSPSSGFRQREDRLTTIPVIIIGAGLGGCAAALAMRHHGHDVVVYEKLANFRRLGDSLGLGENALKLLRRWGGDRLYESLTSIGNQAENMQIRRWRDGRLLAQQPLMDMAGYIGHRGDYHEAFLRGVREAGIEVNMGYEVVGFDEGSEGDGKPSVTFKDGRVEEADVVVGADGIKSRARELVLGFSDAPKSSGYSCWRAYFPGEHLGADDLCKDFVDHDCVNIWWVVDTCSRCSSASLSKSSSADHHHITSRIGEDTHLVQNTLRGGKEFNWIITRKLSHEADMEIKESWFQEGDLDDVLAHVTDLDPRIVAAIQKTPSLLDWKICYRDPLPTWVSKGHKIALLGDSCHPHLPTSAQGASQATESAAVLAVCLKLAGRGEIPLAVRRSSELRGPPPTSGALSANLGRAKTRTYERIRFGRTRQSQTAGEDLRDRWHNALKNLEEGVHVDPDSVKMRNRWLYKYDAEADAVERWDEVSSKVASELRENSITPLCETAQHRRSQH